MTDDELAEKRHMADAALRRAVELHAEAHHLDDDSHLLSTYIVVSHWLGESGRGRYILQPDGMDGMPSHVARGLLNVGIEIAVGEPIDDG